MTPPRFRCVYIDFFPSIAPFPCFLSDWVASLFIYFTSVPAEAVVWWMNWVVASTKKGYGNAVNAFVLRYVSVS